MAACVITWIVSGNKFHPEANSKAQKKGKPKNSALVTRRFASLRFTRFFTLVADKIIGQPVGAGMWFARQL